MRHVAIALMLLAPPAFAQTAPTPTPKTIDTFLTSPATTPAPKTIDMTRVIMTDKGLPMKDPADVTPDDKVCSKCRDLTIGDAISYALNGSYEDERNLSFQQRFDRATLAKHIKDDPQATLNAAETAVIERLLGKAGFTGPVILQIVAAIEPNLKAGQVQ